MGIELRPCPSAACGFPELLRPGEPSSLLPGLPPPLSPPRPSRWLCKVCTVTPPAPAPPLHVLPLGFWPLDLDPCSLMTTPDHSAFPSSCARNPQGRTAKPPTTLVTPCSLGAGDEQQGWPLRRRGGRHLPGRPEGRDRWWRQKQQWQGPRVVRALTPQVPQTPASGKNARGSPPQGWG